MLPQGWCPDCGRWRKAQVPAEHATGYRLRFRALRGEGAGTSGNGRRIVPTFCAAVLQVPVSLGAIQQVLDRVTEAIAPHSLAIATQGRHAVVNYSDETPWFLARTVEGCLDELRAFHRAFRECFGRSEPREHFFRYMVGQLSTLRMTASAKVVRHAARALTGKLKPLPSR